MITVIRPGSFTSYQDGGRSGLAHLGVPRAGAADSLSLRQANLLAGNPEYSAALEMTLHGPSLRFEHHAVIALAGGRLEANLDDTPIPMYQSVQVRAGQVLACGRLLTGMRSYLAIAGGFLLKSVLNSISTDTLAGLGPPVLQAGDVLEVQSHMLSRGWYLRSSPDFSDNTRLRVVAGPHIKSFSSDAWQVFLESEFEVQAHSDRTGLRLGQTRLSRADIEELHSQGMVCGAIQVPGDGHPIILLPNHGTTGGYPVIAVVISADLPQLGQLRAGTKLRFQLVTREQALQALQDSEKNLRAALVPADPGLLMARSVVLLAKSHPVLREVNLKIGQRTVHLRR